MSAADAHCADGVRNGDELGVDCGGSCSASCSSAMEPCDCARSEALLPIGCGRVELWTAFLTSDGSTLVYGQAGATYRFTLQGGLRDLTSAVVEAGADLEGWELSEPSALSADGRVVVGMGTCGGIATA